MDHRWLSRAAAAAALGYSIPTFASVASSPLPLGAQQRLQPAAAPVAAGVAVPTYSSDPGAPYTIYLDFGGFAFNGNWGNNATYVPGTTPAYDVDGDATTFSSTELTNIHTLWSRIAQKYAPFNINVTTVDPAVAAGQSSSDTLRQNYYDSKSQLMHTVIGGTDSWVVAGGISYLGTTPYSETGSNGYHTNFVFSAESPNNFQFISDAAAHENGHGLGLDHQTNLNADNSVKDEYSAGNSDVSPIMGVTYNSGGAPRGLWTLGTSHSGIANAQNDAQIIANDPNMGGYHADGIGHTLATATHLPTSSNAITYSSAKGIIVPASVSSPNPIGASNYTADHWSFTTLGGSVTLTINSGQATFGSPAPDDSPTLDATLALYNSAGTLIQMLDTTSLSESLITTLTKGSYDLVVLSHGGQTDATSNNRGFYDMGSYFLSGSIPTPVAGDANLDGKVNIADLGALATHYGYAGGFQLGDFNYDGTVNIADLGLLATNYGYGSPSPLPLSFQQALAQIEAQTGVEIPEPGGIAVLVVASTSVLGRMRRRV